MGDKFSFYNYLLMLVSIFSHYSIGKRIVKSTFIVNCLVGVTCSALVVGSLANILSGVIRHYIVGSILVGISFIIYDMYKKFRTKRHVDYLLKFTLIVIGFLIFYINNPKDIFIEESFDNKYNYIYEPHQTVWSSQSIEMLSASYMDRLKVRNVYPNYWKRYHFFNTSTIAIVAGLIKSPGLFEYQMSKMIIIIFILLSFGEILLTKYKVSIKNIMTYLFWLIMGFSIFSFGFLWNFHTSGMFSIFAAVHLMFSIMFKKYSNAIMFSIILGASVVRLFPSALLSILLIIMIFYKDDFKIRNLVTSIKQNILKYLFFVLLIFYYFITMFSPKLSMFPPLSLINQLVIYIYNIFKINFPYYTMLVKSYIDNSFIVVYIAFIISLILLFMVFLYLGKVFLKFYYKLSIRFKEKYNIYIFTVGCIIFTVFSVILSNGKYNEPLVNGWLSTVAVHNWIGFISHLLLDVDLFVGYNTQNRFAFIQYGEMTTYLTVAVVFLLVLSIISKFFVIIKNRRLYQNIFLNKYFYIPTFLLLFASFFSVQIMYLNIIAFISLFIVFICMYNFYDPINDYNTFELNKSILFYFYMYLGVIFLIFISPHNLFGPMPSIIFSVSLWGILSILLYNVQSTKHTIISHFLVLLLCVLSGIKIQGILKEDLNFNDTKKIDISVLINGEFSRSKYVDKNNSFIFPFKQPEYSDVYSAILGSTLNYNVDYKIKRVIRNYFMYIQ